MSKSSKARSAADRQMDERIVQFCGVTGSSTKDAKRFLEKYKRLDVAIDAFYNNPNEFVTPGVQRVNVDRVLTSLFDKYKDPDGTDITIDGTIKLCEDLGVNPEDVVMLAVAYELKSPSVGQWTKQGWIEGWKSLGCDSLESMKREVQELANRLASEPGYYKQVYSYTFNFARTDGQRSIPQETAQAFWSLLIPCGLKGGALSHLAPDGDEEDVDMTDGEDEGWKEEYTQWWFDFLNEKGGKGVSKDTWHMFLDFVRSIDSKFEKYDETAAWPSTIDDFVSYARERLAAGS